MAEIRRFRMNPKLLYDVILRQAGSLSKAILEGVMNSVDAAATRCDITLSEGILTIHDDGKGITTRREIEEFFETFGTPHDESEHKVFGTFRMGRGQLFAYGVNNWQTGPFTMAVDVKGKGLDYELSSNGMVVDGCVIGVSLYERLLPSDLVEAERSIEAWAKYAPLVVTFNGVEVTVDPSTEKWDHVTDDAYIRLKDTGEVSLYNLGVYVCGFPNYRLGSGGVIVSKRQLKMNFARNDVQSDCPVWKRVKPFFVDRSSDAASKTKVLKPWQRQNIRMRVRNDLELTSQMFSRSYLEMSNGRCFSPANLCNGTYWGRYHRRMTFAPKGDAVADKVLSGGLALVVSNECLSDFRLEPTKEGLREMLRVVLSSHYHVDHLDHFVKMWEIVDFATISKGVSATMDIVPEKKLTPNEVLWLRIARACVYSFNDGVMGWKPRKIVVGDSPGLLAWTDGSTYVALERRFLRELEFDVKGAATLGLILAHELAHSDSDIDGHHHDQAFYEEFHELAMGKVPFFTSSVIAELPKQLAAANRRMSKKVAAEMDRHARIEREKEGR